MTKMIAFRITDPELKRLKETVKRSGLTQQKFIINCLLEKPVFFEFLQWQEIRAELRRVGINLNQIAKALNQKNTADHNELAIVEELKKELELWRLLKPSAVKKPAD